MSTTTTLVTVEEFLKIPEPKGGHYELHHGEVVFVAAPKWGHSEIQDRVTVLLKGIFGSRGTVMMEMPFQPAAEYEVWVADVAFVSRERAERTAKDEYLQGAPDLVVEVLSPSNTVDEINDKMAICLENGCSSFWIIDPKRKEIKVTEGDITRRYQDSATITSNILGASIQVREIFQGS